MSRRSASQSRRGVSLAELLLLLSIIMVLISLSAKLIHRVMWAHSKSVAFQRSEQSAWRLASQFRRDVHAADAAVVGAESEQNQVTLTNAGQRHIEYRVTGRSVIRTLAEGEKPVSREAFNFPSELVLHVEKLDSPERVLFVLESTSHTVPGPDQRPLRSVERVPLAMRLEACLGRAPEQAMTPAAKEGAP